MRVAVAGEVLGAGGDARALQPATNAATCRATSCGSEPNERTPTIGLAGSCSTSATGARSRSTPPRPGRPPIAAADALASASTSSTAPSARVAGVRAAVAPLEPRDVAALLVDRHAARARRSARSAPHSSPSCSGSSTLRANSTTPPRPALEPGQHPVAAPRGRRSREEAAPPRAGRAASLNPCTAPAVSPNAILRCTSRKKMITGIAISVEPPSAPPQSVFRLVPSEVREPDRDRLLRLVVQQDAREDVLVPARDEREDRGRDEPGRDERQQDPR